jgi:hypothetical protein
MSRAKDFREQLRRAGMVVAPGASPVKIVSPPPTRVYPSAGALAARRVPSNREAPATFSTTIRCPRKVKSPEVMIRRRGCSGSALNMRSCLPSS